MIQVNPVSFQMASDIETRQHLMVQRKEFDDGTTLTVELTIPECASITNHWS